MAAVAISILRRKKMEDNRQIVNALLTFGDGATTYPAGGIPIPGGSFGCPRYVDSVFFEDDAGSSRMLKYDVTNQKVRVWVEGAAVYAEMTGVIPAFTAKVQVLGAR